MDEDQIKNVWNWQTIATDYIYDIYIDIIHSEHLGVMDEQHKASGKSFYSKTKINIKEKKIHQTSHERWVLTLSCLAYTSNINQMVVHQCSWMMGSSNTTKICLAKVSIHLERWPLLAFPPPPPSSLTPSPYPILGPPPPTHTQQTHHHTPPAPFSPCFPFTPAQVFSAPSRLQKWKIDVRAFGRCHGNHD